MGGGETCVADVLACVRLCVRVCDSFFVEHNILSYLLRAVIAPVARKTRLRLLQVLNILVENLQNEMSICMLPLVIPGVRADHH